MPGDVDESLRRRHREPSPHVLRIKVIGVGGGGGNAVNRMIDAGVAGVDFIAMNTDIQALQSSKASVTLQLGAKLTGGLGAGGDADVGRRAALDDSGKVIELLQGADMVFVTAGLGGGSGTGAAPVIASLASGMGALTVAVVTQPFRFEGKRRVLQAERGLQALLDAVDTLIVIPNDRLLAAAKDAGFFESFRVADDVLRQAVQSITDIITVPGIINRDFADVKNIMSGMGHAVMGTASRAGPNRAAEAATAAMASPMLEANAIIGARAILINISGSSSLRLSEVNEASTIIQAAGHEDANIIFGAVLDNRLGEEIKVTVIATDFHDRLAQRKFPSVKTGLSAHTSQAFPVQNTETPEAVGSCNTEQSGIFESVSSKMIVDELQLPQAASVVQSLADKVTLNHADSTSDVSQDELSPSHLLDEQSTDDQEDPANNAAEARVHPHPMTLEATLSSMQRAAVAGYAAASAHHQEAALVEEPSGFAEILQDRLESLETETTRIDESNSGPDDLRILRSNGSHAGDPLDSLSLESIMQMLREESELQMQAEFESNNGADSGVQDLTIPSPIDNLSQSHQPMIHHSPQVDLPAGFLGSPIFHVSSGAINVSPAFENHAQAAYTTPVAEDVMRGKNSGSGPWNALDVPPQAFPFAGMISTSAESSEMDELDIPAFLRRDL